MDNVITTYNGWCNRETWLAGLWLTNDDGSYVLQEAISSSDNPFDQAECLEQLMFDQLANEASEASLWSDLLSTSFGRINWSEIVSNNS